MTPPSRSLLGWLLLAILVGGAVIVAPAAVGANFAEIAVDSQSEQSDPEHEERTIITHEAVGIADRTDTPTETTYFWIEDGQKSAALQIALFTTLLADSTMHQQAEPSTQRSSVEEDEQGKRDADEDNDQQAERDGAIGDDREDDNEEDGDTTIHHGDDTADSPTPGVDLSGVIHLYSSDARALVEEREIEQRFQAAETDEHLDEVSRDLIERMEASVEELEQRADQLRQARAAGTIGDEEYRIRMAQIDRQRTHLLRQSIDSEVMMQGRSGTFNNAAAIANVSLLQDRIASLGGVEASRQAAKLGVDEFASSIAEQSRETRLSGDERDHGDAERYLDSAGQAVDLAESRVDRAAEVTRTGESADMEEATDNLEAAYEALDGATTAFDAREYSETVRWAVEARVAAANAKEIADELLDEADGTDREAATEAMETATTQIDRAQADIESARQHTDAIDNDLAIEMLAEGQATLERAKNAMTAAETAVGIDAYHRAVTEAETASDFANRTLDYATRILDINDQETRGSDESREAIDEAISQLDEAENTIDRAREVVTDDSDAQDVLERAERSRSSASSRLSIAEAHHDDEQYERAMRTASDATDEAYQAYRLAERAIILAEQGDDDDGGIDDDDSDGDDDNGEDDDSDRVDDSDGDDDNGEDRR